MNDYVYIVYSDIGPEFVFLTLARAEAFIEGFEELHSEDAGIYKIMGLRVQ